MFPPTSIKQAPRHWHIPYTFSRYSLNCLPYLGYLLPHIENADRHYGTSTFPFVFDEISSHVQHAGIMAPVYFPHILAMFSSLSSVSTKLSHPHSKKQATWHWHISPSSRDILFIVPRTHEIFPPHPKRRPSLDHPWQD
jgi:hypothetical protein